MQTQLEIHPIQATILRELLFKPEARFSELNIKDLTTDHFTFHISRLLESKLVEKTTNNKYTLTNKGKEFANRLDTDIAKIERQPKVGVSVICVKEERKIKKYLIQKRLKQPYFGYHGVITGKVRWGETMQETAARELLEETGLIGEITLRGIKHKMDYNKEKSLLEDKIFFVHIAVNCKGDLKETFEGGENHWYSVDEIQNLDNLFPDVWLLLEMTQNPELKFYENKYIVDKY